MDTRQREIWKYPLALQDTQHLIMPRGAELLAVQMQGEHLILWALANPHGIPVKRAIAILGTGQRVSAESVSPTQYIGTVQEGGFVWHIFDMGEAI